MIDRVAVGDLPPKHHVALRGSDGALRHEECLTRDGFDGPYTIMYHRGRPQAQDVADAAELPFVPLERAAPRPLRKRHYVSPRIVRRGGPAAAGRTPLVWNEDVVVGVVRPDAADPVYFSNGDGDDLYYVLEGGGTLRSVLGDLSFGAHDYVCVPRGVLHRFIPSPGIAQTWLHVECLGNLGPLKQFRNEAGQLRMDAPYCHRDFRRPSFAGPLDEGIRKVIVKQGHALHGFVQAESPLDVVGWDGTVYPWVFSIFAFQPRVSSVHLPPTWHGTFASRGALVCSFVPRLVDFHPEAIPCPYPHSSTHCDEIIFYCRGNFTSRRGVGPGSISHHPMGIPHGPHPGAYEASIGTRSTDELAVMLDTFRPLQATPQALEIEDEGYHRSFL